VTPSGGEVSINGTSRSLPEDRAQPLLRFLREGLGLWGTKYGCGEGECGACTVLLDGLPVPACRTRVSEVAGRRVVTIEGLSRDGRLSPVQRAFAEAGAFQCGFCTPGMVVRATALLRTRPDPEEREIREALEPNICRCGGYPGILRAVRLAATLAREPGGGL
jgi:aerobic-type carbon monoxide dehydrogenase small subunit (CoxS/CutS family)